MGERLVLTENGERIVMRRNKRHVGLKVFVVIQFEEGIFLHHKTTICLRTST